MRNIFTTLAKAGKDLVLGELGKFLLNRLGLEPYGEFTYLAVDTDQKQITFALLLNGEEKSVTGTICYHLEASGADLIMVADSATVSREWMNVLFERHFAPERRRFLIPPKLHSIIRISGV